MSTKEESEQRIGTVVEQKWRLDALIGYSSIAATYKARHRNGLEVALKIIHRSHCEFASVVDRFLQEAHLANRVDHPGVERVFDDGKTEDGCVFLVMELLEGETLELRRVSSGGHLRLGEARPIIDGLLDAVVAVHAAGVLHRNLKPGNVFLTKDGRVVLTDFGRARLADDPPQSRFSIGGLVVGSPAYMAPEQAKGRRHEVDARSDIWSVGAIMFTLLTGRRIHDGATPQEKLLHAQTQPAPAIRELLPGFNSAIAGVLDRALAFERSDRWPSASEMRRAWWLATGRDETTLPKDKQPGQRPVPKKPSTPPSGWEAMGWPTEPERPRVVDLEPPPLEAFVEPAPPKRQRRWLKRTIVVLAALLFVSLVAGFVATNCADDAGRQPAIAPTRSASS